MYLGTVIASIIAYLTGSISWSIVLVYLKTRKDVRTLGSMNAGATNASRVIGKHWGLFIVFLDSTKVIVAGIIAMGINAIPNDLFNQTSLMIPAFFALLGHTFPIYHKFKGGKAVSCFIGIALLANGILGALFIVAWWIIILSSRKVSLASILAAAFIAGLAWVPQISGLSSINFNGAESFYQAYEVDHFYANFANRWHNWNPSNGGDVQIIVDGKAFNSTFYDSFVVINIVVVASALIIIIKHRSNIERLFRGDEPAFFEYNKELRKIKKEERLALKQKFLEEKQKMIEEEKIKQNEKSAK